MKTIQNWKFQVPLWAPSSRVPPRHLEVSPVDVLGPGSHFSGMPEIGINILNLLWNTCFMCILLSDSTNTVVIRLTNKKAQITGSRNNLLQHFKKKMRASVWEKKSSSRSWPCELDEVRSLWWEINCSLC